MRDMPESCDPVALEVAWLPIHLVELLDKKLRTSQERLAKGEISPQALREALLREMDMVAEMRDKAPEGTTWAGWRSGLALYQRGLGRLTESLDSVHLDGLPRIGRG